MSDEKRPYKRAELRALMFSVIVAEMREVLLSQISDCAVEPLTEEEVGLTMEEFDKWADSKRMDARIGEVGDRLYRRHVCGEE